MKDGGFWAASKVHCRLLAEQFPDARPYENLEACRIALKDGQVSWILGEDQGGFRLQTQNRDMVLSNPLKFKDLQVLLERFCQTYRVGTFVFDPLQRTLSSGTEETIPLREKESQLLWTLLESPDFFVSREGLLEAVWGLDPEALIETRTLESHIYQLRQKIESNPRDPQILVSREGGYQLVVS